MTGRKKRLLITGAISAVCLIAMLFVVARGPRKVVRFAPPPFEETAVKGVPTLTKEDGFMPLDVDVYRFSICGELTLSDGKTDIWLTNDESNEVWLKVMLKDSKGNKLGETGLIHPGEYVQSVKFDVIPQATEDIGMVIMSYEPETYYSMGSVTLYTKLFVPENIE